MRASYLYQSVTSFIILKPRLNRCWNDIQRPVAYRGGRGRSAIWRGQQKWGIRSLTSHTILWDGKIAVRPGSRNPRYAADNNSSKSCIFQHL